MKIKKINLLSHHKNYLLYQKYFLLFRKIVFFSTGLFFVLLITSLLIITYKKNQVDVLIQQEQNLQTFIKNNLPVEENFKKFNNLFNQLKENLNNDVNFYPYYNLINDSLKISTNPPTIESLKIDQNKKVNFTLTFNNTNHLIEFLDYVEEEPFLNNFVNLKLESFLVESPSLLNTSNSYKISFVGQFKKIDNEN